MCQQPVPSMMSMRSRHGHLMEESMNTWKRGLLLAGIFSMAVLSACSVSVSAAPIEDDQAPVQVVESFYSWMISHAEDDPELVTFRDPLDYNEYSRRTELGIGLIEQVQKVITASDQGAGYYSLLCTRDVPSDIETLRAEVDWNTALVKVQTSFKGHSFLVELTRPDSDTAWRISDVECGIDR
jgi:hypothetical protein